MTSPSPAAARAARAPSRTPVTQRTFGGGGWSGTSCVITKIGTPSWWSPFQRPAFSQVPRPERTARVDMVSANTCPFWSGWFRRSSQDDVGAIVMGRTSFEKNEGDGGWSDGGPHGASPCFVVTHRAPDREYSPVFTFVADGVESAIGQAQEAAGDKAVALHGATIMQQAHPLGLVDEFHLHTVPVLVGDGTPLFSHLADAVELRRTDVVVTPSATHLRYAVGHDW